MKTRIKKAVKILFILLIFINIYGKNYAQSTSEVILPSASTSWELPQLKVASIKIQAWGGGGSGGGHDNDNQRGAGGGGGGAYVEFIKTSGFTGIWSYAVGRGGVGGLNSGLNGSDTWVNFSTTEAPTNLVGLLANGGIGGKKPQNKDVNGGDGGSAANSFVPVSGGSGEIKLDGEAGEGGTRLSSGKGGDSPNGGIGGAADNLGGNGNAGSIPGGGGSGAFINNAIDRLGGNGGDGKIVLTITYIDAPTASNQNLCIGSKISDLVTSNTLSGSSIKWFTQQTDGTELLATTTLTDNTTYYVSQTFNEVESNRTAVLVTLNPDGVAGSISGGATVCSGTNSTLLTLSGNIGTINWQSSTDGINYNNISSATDQTYTASNLTSKTYYKALVTSGACASLTTSAVAVLVKQPGSWIGAVSTHWNYAENWCGSIPNAETDVTISNESTNQPLIGLANVAVRSLTISSGSSLTITSNMTLNVFGDWINNGTFTANSGTVNFKKVGNQAIGGANVSTFNNVSFEGGGSKVISKDVQINGAATFTSGYITSTNNSKLIFQSESSIASGVANDASFAMVEVIKYGNADFEFPIGGMINSENKYRPIKVSNLQNTSITDNFSANHVASDPLYNFSYLVRGNSLQVFKNELAQTLSTLSSSEYWNLSRSNLTSVANVTIDFSQYPTTIANAQFLRMGHYNATDGNLHWENAPSVAGTRSYDFLTKKLTVTNVNKFSPFAVASITTAALPVTLTSFTAKPTSTNTVALNWVTSSEIVNKGFRIERQAGGVNGKFESIGFVNSKAVGGNSQNALNYNFIDASPRNGATTYYRLAQENLDGKITFSEVRVVKLNGETVSMVFPNPSNGAVNISRTANGKKMNIQVIDMGGRMVQQFTNITDSNFKLNISKSGVYNLKITYPETGEQSVQRIVIEN